MEDIEPQIVDRSREKVFRALAMASILAIFVFSYFDWRSSRTATNQAEQTRRILAANEQVLSAVKDAETSQRGYLLTGQDVYLEPYRRAVRELQHMLDEFSASVATKPRQKQRVSRIRALIGKKLDELRETILLRQQKGVDAALAVVETGAGLALMDQIRSLCGEVSRSEYNDLVEHTNTAAMLANRRRLIVGAGSFVLFILLILAGNAVGRATEESQKLYGKLDESRQQLQTTLVSIGDAVMATDLNGNITFANPVAQSLTGWTETEMSGKPLASTFRIVNEDTRNTVENPVAKVLRGGQVVGLANHTLLLRKDGSEVPIDDSGAPIRDRDGQVAGVVLVFRDITDRRKAERDIERWKQIFDNAGFGMTLLGPDFRFESVNAMYAALHGYTVHEMSGKSLFDVVAPECRESVAGTLRETGEKGHQVYESTHIRKDGSRFFCLVDMTVFRDAAGAEAFRCAYVSDISERRRQQEALRESEERFRSLATALPQLVWSARPEGAVEYVNPLWREYAGWPEDRKPEGEVWAELLHSEDREAYGRGWSESLRAGSQFEIQARFRRSCDGTYRWFLCRAVPVRDAAGRLVRWLGTCTDIDDQVQSAAQLQRANEALRRSNADLEQFAYAASHDLQEPLRMVAIYTQLLREEYRDKLDGPANTYIDFASSGARRMEALLKDLLLYSRVATSQDGASEMASATRALQDALLNLEAAAQRNQATIHYGELPCVRIPEFQLVQLFQNLISNALKYRSATRPVIQVQAARTGGDWQFSIQDNGIGIEPQYLQQIFGVFKRLHGREYEGTGIGLAMCQKIVERNGGRIWVESEAGKGSNFFFTLRACDSAE